MADFRVVLGGDNLVGCLLFSSIPLDAAVTFASYSI